MFDLFDQCRHQVRFVFLWTDLTTCNDLYLIITDITVQPTKSWAVTKPERIQLGTKLATSFSKPSFWVSVLVFGGVSQTNLFLLFLVISIRLPPKIYHMMVQGFKVFPVFSRLLLIHIECFKQNIQNHQKQSKRHVVFQPFFCFNISSCSKKSPAGPFLLMDFWWNC